MLRALWPWPGLTFVRLAYPESAFCDPLPAPGCLQAPGLGTQRHRAPDIQIFEDANLCCLHAKRVTIHKKDMKVVTSGKLEENPTGGNLRMFNDMTKLWGKLGHINEETKKASKKYITGCLNASNARNKDKVSFEDIFDDSKHATAVEHIVKLGHPLVAWPDVPFNLHKAFQNQRGAVYAAFNVPPFGLFSISQRSPSDR